LVHDVAFDLATAGSSPMAVSRRAAQFTRDEAWSVPAFTVTVVTPSEPALDWPPESSAAP